MRGGVFRGAAVGGESSRRATIAQYTSSPITRTAEGGVSPRWGGGGGVLLYFDNKNLIFKRVKNEKHLNFNSLNNSDMIQSHSAFTS